MALTLLTQQLNNLSKDSNGQLVLRTPTGCWNLLVFHGQLLYATNGVHPVRRWTRALNQHLSKWDWGVESSQLPNHQLWECQLLERGLSQKKLSLIQGKLVIRSVLQECLFELSSYTTLKSDWKPSQKTISILCRAVALSANEMHAVLTTAEQMQQQWQAAGLSHLSPNLAPTLQQETDSQSLLVLDRYLNGQFTLWDISAQLKKSVVEVTRSLIPLVDKGRLKFKEIPDLPLATDKPPVAVTPPLPETKPTQVTQKQPLIACIDDSPVLAHSLKKILMPAGYQVLSIPEPMRGFTQLIEHKPDLILLDLLLPNADGYSICKFLRETPVFKKTPIIILTAKNTPIDRARAQLAGATEFVGKPPQPQELLQMIQKYLGTVNSEAVSS